jgi:tRNA-Thr(GGU) m(6)t(6)A37 methyltransferase TsaA
MPSEFALRPIGFVESPLTKPIAAPRQGDEGAPDCTLVLMPDMRQALDGIRPGDAIVVVTWLHLADRDVLQVHPRGDSTRPVRGVFATRSQHRPNPLGIHAVEVLGVDDLRVRVRGLEAIDGTPVVDIKPALGPRETR